MSILHDLSEDINFYHRIIFQEKKPTWFSYACILFSSKGFFVLQIYRFSRNLHLKSLSSCLCKQCIYNILILLCLYLMIIVAKCDISPDSCIEPGVFISNRGYIILGASRIGSGTIINECVTIGISVGNALSRKGRPTIGENVWIGPRCLVYGNISIADGVTVLSDSIVNKNIPHRAFVQGNPARIMKNN